MKQEHTGRVVVQFERRILSVVDHVPENIDGSAMHRLAGDAREAVCDPVSEDPDVGVRVIGLDAIVGAGDNLVSVNVRSRQPPAITVVNQAPASHSMSHRKCCGAARVDEGVKSPDPGDQIKSELRNYAAFHWFVLLNEK